MNERKTYQCSDTLCGAFIDARDRVRVNGKVYCAECAVVAIRLHNQAANMQCLANQRGLPGPIPEECDVLVADADYQDPARCGNTASYRLVNGTDRVCVFHRDSAVRLIPTSASHFEPLARDQAGPDHVNHRLRASGTTRCNGKLWRSGDTHDASKPTTCPACR